MGVLRIAVVGLLFITAAKAGIVAPLSIEQLASAPVLAVGRVERIAQGQLVPPASKGQHAGVARHCTAIVQVLRAMPAQTVTRISLIESCAGPYYQMINGHPKFPDIETGRTYV